MRSKRSNTTPGGAPAFSFLVALLLLGVFASACSSLRNRRGVELDQATREKAVTILRRGMHGKEFWPAMHAAEGLTLGGYGAEARAFLEPKLPREHDDQQRCGLAREMVRAGDKAKAQVMLDILAGDDDYGHVHAAESLYKVGEIGDGVAMRAAFAQTENMKLHLMAAAALVKVRDHTAPLALAAIRHQLSSEDGEIVRISAWLLGRIGKASDRRRLHAARQLAEGREKPFEPVIFAMIDHSLAALGDPAGKAALIANLDSPDPAIRTYAATFAGDAKMRETTEKLIEQLDDANEDARIRAAQTLLVFDRLR